MPAITDQDLLCTTCGYNLHTLDESARCPECSTPVRRSLQRSLRDAGTLILEPLAQAFSSHAWLHASALALPLLLIVPPALTPIVLMLVISHAVLTFRLTQPLGERHSTHLPQSIRLGILLFGASILLTIIAFANRTSSNIFLNISLVILILTPAFVTICKGHYIAHLCRRASLPTLAPWSVGISYYFAATLTAWLTCIRFYPLVSLTPQPLWRAALITTTTLVYLACIAATIHYFHLARHFRKIAHHPPPTPPASP